MDRVDGASVAVDDCEACAGHLALRRRSPSCFPRRPLLSPAPCFVSGGLLCVFSNYGGGVLVFLRRRGFEGQPGRRQVGPARENPSISTSTSPASAGNWSSIESKINPEKSSMQLS
ncbi:hypothetical protein BRADI_2g08984v3 [Brachypodium distachyon]|uniref:Uncharacterized protein n=1 Tax=Brachypodium distachyon TaxID=15368 RepID=A0A2K2D7L3_BRADI|nr:hypothetical protein BRADI_2g08984v3 [Brachypodium distachyon]